MKHLSLFFLFLLFISADFASGLNRPELKSVQMHIFEEAARKAWVDSTIAEMTDEEKIGQLFMVAAYSNRDQRHFDELAKLIEDHHIGGLIFFQGGPVRQAKMTNAFQEMSNIPLLIAIDGEWGISMRLDSTIVYPRQLPLGAIRDESVIREMGREFARQCRRIGIHMNLAPVADVNNNPRNPVINDRSFGEDKYNVALKSLAYMSGMQDEGVLACAKHFPGHGDTDKDSHYTLPVVRHSMERLKDIELYPFDLMIKHEIASMMIAHMHIPALDSTPNLAVSLSENAVHHLLREQMGFEGLIISDALNMKGVSQFFKPGEVDLKAFKAGNDILLFPEDVPVAIERFKKALDENEITIEQIEKSVERILNAKYKAGLNKPQKIKLENIIEDLNTPEAEWLKRKLYEAAVTMPANEDYFVPIRKLDTLKLATLAIGGVLNSPFQETVDLYANASHFAIDKNAVKAEFDKLRDELSNYDAVLVTMQNMGRFSRNNFGLSQNSLTFLNRLNEKTRVVLSVFGNPYSLKNFHDIPNILVFYEENDVTLHIAPQVIFGGIPVSGTLPVTASERFRVGEGYFSLDRIRLKYTVPEELGINRNDLKKVDRIAQKAIEIKATPGNQVLLAKDGKVFYHKSFGHHTYEEDANEVLLSDLYDLASVTKIAATTISLMQLYDVGAFQLQHKLIDYLPGLDDASVKNLNVRRVLLHEAGLRSWIPFYRNTLVDDPDKRAEIYCNENLGCFTVQVGDGVYIREDYPDTIYKNIITSEINRRPEYRYSDLGFYMFKDVIEQLTGLPFQVYTQKQFYQPLGMHRTSFLPLAKYTLDEIVPTEMGSDFRETLIHGIVHDQGAAMLGGVSGHAGLFGNANDLAKLMQMLTNGGEYGGERFLAEETVEMFTSRQSRNNRRGIGFDKPEMDGNGPTAKSASERTFGHSGFTGTGTWADPENELVYVFLSNRIHPSASNRKLISENIRTEIHEAAYQAIRNAKPLP